jgi:salicylate 5-hydroxylase large subunit
MARTMITSEPKLERTWDHEGSSRIPYWLYTDPAIFQREMDRLFYSDHWCYVGLAAEIPNPGDFKRTYVGERSVIMTRDKDGAINVVANRCAHRGVQFCQKDFGSTKTFVCPYHQWSYDLKGNLIGLPFRKGFRQGDRVNGGMPDDFTLNDHGLIKLKVEEYNGVVFASFDDDVESIRAYLGPEIQQYFERIFNGRTLTVLGYSRQRIPGNWKLMQENIKDPYHPGLLHTWFVTFGLWRADQKSEMIVDKFGRHAAMVSRRNDGGKSEATAGVSSFKENMKLHDARVLDIAVEPWWNGPTVTMLTLFPSLIIQQQVNSLSTRHIIPRGPGAFDFVWTHFGFAEDDEEMTRRRLRQANLFGPAGYVSADDGEVIELSQRGFEQHPDRETICELDGVAVGHADHNITETLIRSMYRYYREVMEL